MSPDNRGRRQRRATGVYRSYPLMGPADVLSGRTAAGACNHAAPRLELHGPVA
jgi:hypothetical protein